MSLNILLLIIYERTLKKERGYKGHTDDIDRFASQSIIFERILVIGFEFKFASSNELPWKGWSSLSPLTDLLCNHTLKQPSRSMLFFMFEFNNLLCGQVT